MDDENYLAFYTCFYGDDNNCAFAIPPIPSYKYKCYYYSNNKNLLEKIKNTYWIGIYDNVKISDNITISTMQCKRIKTSPHEYNEIKNYKYLCFLDSKLERINEHFVLNKIDEYFIKQNYAMLLRYHHFVGNNIWNEYNESMKQERYVLEKDKYTNYINKQLKNGLSETTNQHVQCNFIIRNMNHIQMIKINKTWYKHINECGIQDQISFFFIKQIFKNYITHLCAYEPFSFKKNLVIFKSSIDFDKTLDIIDNIKQNIENPYIVVIENTKLLKKDEDELISNIDYYINDTNDSNEFDILFKYLKTNKDNFNSITKLSDEYYFSKKIDIYHYFDNNKYINKNKILINKNWYCILNNEIDKFINILQKSINNKEYFDKWINNKKNIHINDL